MAGGSNSQEGLQLLPALVTLGKNPEIQLCQVFAPSELTPDMTVMEQALHQLIRHCNFASSITAAPVKASSVSEGVINLVKTADFDVIVLGASREGLLEQTIKGNIPEAIATHVKSTVILVRSLINKGVGSSAKSERSTKSERRFPPIETL
ncbi:MAG: universal stress protein, partial [Chroococcidiopsidaceae cyanobacterium CP_BM_RX_35]|nr:universal stress protein [Chroococcidiopsidaceae cyanobacterium CP_BM_RX_35]